MVLAYIPKTGPQLIRHLEVHGVSAGQHRMYSRRLRNTYEFKIEFSHKGMKGAIQSIDYWLPQIHRVFPNLAVIHKSDTHAPWRDGNPVLIAGCHIIFLEDEDHSEIFSLLLQKLILMIEQAKQAIWFSIQYTRWLIRAAITRFHASITTELKQASNNIRLLPAPKVAGLLPKPLQPKGIVSAILVFGAAYVKECLTSEAVAAGQVAEQKYWQQNPPCEHRTLADIRAQQNTITLQIK